MVAPVLYGEVDGIVESIAYVGSSGGGRAVREWMKPGTRRRVVWKPQQNAVRMWQIGANTAVGFLFGRWRREYSAFGEIDIMLGEAC